MIYMGSSLNLVGMVVGALIFTFLSQHIGKKNCMFLFAGLMTISSLVLYFAGYHNAIVLFATSSVSTVCVGAVMGLCQRDDDGYN